MSEEKTDFPYSQASVYVYEAPLRLFHRLAPANHAEGGR